MTRCSECGAEISSKASNCPNCGYARNWMYRPKANYIALVILIALVGLVAVMNKGCG